MHHNNVKGETGDFKINFDEFKEYYANISASIDDDEYFAAMMNSSWNIDGNAESYKNQPKGWAGEEGASGHACYNPNSGNGQPTQFSGMMSCDYPFSNITDYYKGGEKRNRNSLANDNKPKVNNKPGYMVVTGQESAQGLDQSIAQKYESYVKEKKKPVDAGKADDSAARQKQQQIDMDIFRKQIFARGARGVVGLKKQFKLMDTDNSGAVDFSEFMNCINDLKIDFDETRARNVFTMLDHDKGGSISIDEFIDGLIGALSPLRLKLIEQAFQHLDVDNSQRLEMSEVQDMFTSVRHPECITGVKTSDEVKKEFFSLFKSHHNAATGFSGEGGIDFSVFKQYHQILSVFYERDQEFKNFVVGIWSMDVKEVDQTFAGKKPAIQGKNSKEQWRMENYQSLYGNRLLDQGANNKETFQKVKMPYEEKPKASPVDPVKVRTQKEQDEALWTLR